MNLQEAEEIAAEFIGIIDPFCVRVEVAGSVRRRKPDVGDIEIVCVPTFAKQKKISSLIEEYEEINLLHNRLTHLREGGRIKCDRVSKDGKAAPFGPKYYRLTFCSRWHSNNEFPIDVFAVTKPADWGVIFTIRTGSADYSHMLVTRALQLGKKVKDGRLYATHFRDKEEEWEYIPCPEEENFFAALDLDMPLPEERV